jgi:hypothetical protein
VLEISKETVARDWRVAKTWLFRELSHISTRRARAETGLNPPPPAAKGPSRQSGLSSGSEENRQKEVFSWGQWNLTVLTKTPL